MTWKTQGLLKLQFGDISLVNIDILRQCLLKIDLNVDNFRGQFSSHFLEV